MDAIAASTQTAGAPAIEMNGSGEITILLEDGHYGYTIRIVNEIRVDGFPTVSVVEGSNSGSYEYHNGFILAERGAGSVDAFVELNGVRIDAADLGDDLFQQYGAFQEAPYDCNGDNPVIHFDVAPGVARFAMKFVPWVP